MPKKMDRPALVSQICEEIAMGASLRAACAKSGRPSLVNFLRWMEEDDELRNQYAHAREMQATYLADEMLEIVDSEPDPAKARVRMDARKWAASKLAPKKYGDKVTQEHTGPDGGPVKASLTVTFVKPELKD